MHQPVPADDQPSDPELTAAAEARPCRVLERDVARGLRLLLPDGEAPTQRGPRRVIAPPPRARPAPELAGEAIVAERAAGIWTTISSDELRRMIHRRRRHQRLRKLVRELAPFVAAAIATSTIWVALLLAR